MLCCALGIDLESEVAGLRCILTVGRGGSWRGTEGKGGSGGKAVVDWSICILPIDSITSRAKLLEAAWTAENLFASKVSVSM